MNDMFDDIRKKRESYEDSIRKQVEETRKIEDRKLEEKEQVLKKRKDIRDKFDGLIIGVLSNFQNAAFPFWAVRSEEINDDLVSGNVGTWTISSSERGGGPTSDDSFSYWQARVKVEVKLDEKGNPYSLNVDMGSVLDKSGQLIRLNTQTDISQEALVSALKELYSVYWLNRDNKQTLLGER